MADYQLFLGDCLTIMPYLEAGSIDAIIADIPYGTTACKWDSPIPFDPMWAAIRRLIRPRGAVVLFGSQPFTSALVMSNPKWFRDALVWDKVNRYTGYMAANSYPLNRHEDIAIFSPSTPTYNKQYRSGKAYTAWRTNGWGLVYGDMTASRFDTVNDGNHNPCSIIAIEADNKNEHGLHPTQKPLALMEYLVKTYSNPGDLILDFTMGSGTTGHACANIGRRFIGIERDMGYFQTAQERIATAYAPLRHMQEAIAI